MAMWVGVGIASAGAVDPDGRASGWERVGGSRSREERMRDQKRREEREREEGI